MQRGQDWSIIDYNVPYFDNILPNLHYQQLQLSLRGQRAEEDVRLEGDLVSQVNLNHIKMVGQLWGEGGHGNEHKTVQLRIFLGIAE